MNLGPMSPCYTTLRCNIFSEIKTNHFHLHTQFIWNKRTDIAFRDGKQLGQCCDVTSMKRTSKVGLGSIHTCDLLGVNYCVNFSTQSQKMGT